MYVASFIQVLPRPPRIGCPQQPGALSTKPKDGECHGPWCCSQPQPLCVRLVHGSGAGNHQPLTQPSARNEYSDVFPTLQERVRAGFGDLKDLALN